MDAPNSDRSIETALAALRKRLASILRGPLGPFLIAACVVLGFGIRGWLSQPSSILPQEGATLACEVDSVVDGDTMEVVCGRDQMRLRLWGIDAPELPQIPWGERARDALTQLASNARLTIHVMDHDRYGRVVGRVYRADLDIGLRLVLEGFATVPFKYVRDSRYRAAHRAARRDKQGVWSVPGVQQRPWEWRKYNPRPGRSPR